MLFLDCMALKIRDGGSVARKACYIAMAISMTGERELLGLKLVKAWRDAWQHAIPFFAFPSRPGVRRVIYTANAIEASIASCEAVKTKGHFPTEDDARNWPTWRSATACRNGPEPAGGRKPSSRSRFPSETAYPTDNPAYAVSRTPSPPVGKGGPE